MDIVSKLLLYFFSFLMTNDIFSAWQHPSAVWFKEGYKVLKRQLSLSGSGISISCSKMSEVTKVSEREKEEKRRAKINNTV